MDIKKILSEVPDYKGFFTMAELDESTFRLAREFPELVTVTELGRSRGGHPIYCLKIGHYEKKRPCLRQSPPQRAHRRSHAGVPHKKALRG